MALSRYIDHTVMKMKFNIVYIKKILAVAHASMFYI
jgi:hypothetical protein